jgi:hypothetical protein
MKQLEQIAVGLYTAAEHIGIARYRLQRGLVLTLRRSNNDWVLTLGRQGKAPGETEEKICRSAFRVPDEGVERVTSDIEGWLIVRFRWPAAPLSPQGGGV